MRARAVIGANFGDEGKGLVTDYLCATQGAGHVVRFNGGAQAGHTVEVGDTRHVFHHFGSGALAGVPTFLSEDFICNPILFFKEQDDLRTLNVGHAIYADPRCLITTFADMIINQRMEDARGDKRHGSCGVGIHETITRNRVISLTIGDLWNKIGSLESKVAEICDRYATFRTGSPIIEPEMAEAFIKGCWAFADHVWPMGPGQLRDPVFEGAQGLLLDMDNKDHFPHVTHSKTGLHNVVKVCNAAGIDSIEPYYVTRTYLTRHGAGVLPGEDPTMAFTDVTNVDHPYQGKLRFAPITDAFKRGLMDRILVDAGGRVPRIVLTCCDQHPSPEGLEKVVLLSHGPDRGDVSEVRQMWGMGRLHAPS